MQSAELSHQARASYLDETVLPVAAVMKPLLEEFDPYSLDYAALRAKAGSDAGDRGIQELYYAGMYTWQAIREQQLPSQDAAGVFRNAGRVALEHFTFRSHPQRFIDGQLQSSLSAPTILAAWTILSGNEQLAAPAERTDFEHVARSVVLDILKSDWFPDLLRAASVTNSGLYRNSTGHTLRYESFARRSILPPLRHYQRSNPVGQFPVVSEAAERGSRTNGQLSPEFQAFLRQRMRDHNRSIEPEQPLYEGTSNGCPFARSVHQVSDTSLLSPAIGELEDAGLANGKAKIRLTWDPYRQICQVLASVLERLG